jgi:taurine dioxygenase
MAPLRRLARRLAVTLLISKIYVLIPSLLQGVAVKITRMAGAFGATVGDVDLGATLDATTFQELVDGLYDHRILLIPGQRLTNQAYAEFGGRWGDPIVFFVPGARDRQFPSIIRITNSPATPEASRDGAMHWHSDSSYEAVPASVTMLYGIEVPLVGNETLFADCASAYDALPRSMREQVDPLVVVHDPKGGKVNIEGEVRGRGQTEPLPVVTHPLVIEHPVTGRRSLFGFSGTAAGIVGCDEADAIDLLLEVKRHVLQPRFRQQARVDVGSVLLWDNYSVVHSATPTVYSEADSERRLLHRISTRGLPEPYRGRAA